jgi:ACT domain-containing protein
VCKYKSNDIQRKYRRKRRKWGVEIADFQRERERQYLNIVIIQALTRNAACHFAEHIFASFL